MFFTRYKVAFVIRLVGPCFYSVTMLLVIAPFTFVHWSAFDYISSNSMDFAVFPIACVYITVCTD